MRPNFPNLITFLTVLIVFSNPLIPRIRKALENKSNMEDDRVAILEAQLAQAKLIAEEADKKYEEVRTMVPWSQPLGLVYCKLACEHLGYSGAVDKVDLDFFS